MKTRNAPASRVERMLEAELPDLVLIDCTIDGAAACGVVKREHPELPVIAVVDAATKLALVRAGADHCVTRPLDIEELRARAGVLIAAGARHRGELVKLDTLRLWHDWVRYVIHDLRNPVTVALASVSSAVLEPEADNAELLLAARRSLDETAALLRDIHDTDRIKHGVLTPMKEHIDLVDLATEVVAAATSPHPVHVRAKGDTRIYADRVLIRRVFGNLISNAARHARMKPIEVEIDPGQRRDAERLLPARAVHGGRRR